MKGNNELILNEATLIEAMQEYLDKRMGEFAPAVKSIKWGGKYDGFTVSVSGKELGR